MHGTDRKLWLPHIWVLTWSVTNRNSYPLYVRFDTFPAYTVTLATPCEQKDKFILLSHYPIKMKLTILSYTIFSFSTLLSSAKLTSTTTSYTKSLTMIVVLCWTVVVVLWTTVFLLFLLVFITVAFSVLIRILRWTPGSPVLVADRLSVITARLFVMVAWWGRWQCSIWY